MSHKNLLQFNVKLLRLLNLWPTESGSTSGTWRTVKDFFFVFCVTPSCISVVAGLYLELLDESRDLNDITEAIIATACCVGLFYVIICFLQNRDNIIELVEELQSFEKFGTPPDLVVTDKKVALFTTLFLIYGIIGTLVYVTMPIVSIPNCEANKSQFMKNIGVPCGLVVNIYYLPFRYEFSPRREIILIYQAAVCITFSTVIGALTMMLCGFLMHIVTHIRYLGSKLEKLSMLPTEQAVKRRRVCILFHIAIIEYAAKMNRAFGSMMLLHITVTSLVISVLGFQVLLTNNYADSLRYGLHLGGWLSILFLVCYNGQILNDESIKIAKHAYFASWYHLPVAVQKEVLLMIMRSQRPLPLTALNFGHMTLATYLQVLSTSYSYFMLLLKMKS